MSGRHHFNVLSGAFSRDHLMEQGKANGVGWEEHSEPNQNWMRFSTAVSNHLDAGKPFHVDNTEPEVLKNLLQQYKGLRDTHKKTMIPHVRAAMQKLRMDSGDPAKGDMDFLKDVYEHLDANGGHHWAGKVSVLSNLNNHISKLTQRLTDMGHEV